MNREVCVKSLRQILGILRILAKKNYCAVIASAGEAIPMLVDCFVILFLAMTYCCCHCERRRSNLSIIILISPSVIPTKVGIQIFVPLLLEGTF